MKIGSLRSSTCAKTKADVKDDSVQAVLPVKRIYGSLRIWQIPHSAPNLLVSYQVSVIQSALLDFESISATEYNGKLLHEARGWNLSVLSYTGIKLCLIYDLSMYVAA